jgi:hypothetical protein
MGYRGWRSEKIKGNRELRSGMTKGYSTKEEGVRRPRGREEEVGQRIL